jgi:hypothetical protein
MCVLYSASCECGGHGSCMTIQNVYANYATHGVNDTYQLWDANHTTMCVCDYGEYKNWHLIFINARILR